MSERVGVLMEKWFSELSIVSPQIFLQSNKQAIIEGCRGLVKYENDFLQILTKQMQLKFYGTNLTVKRMNTESMIITGEFERIEFIK